MLREHRIEMIGKFTLALTCLIFFFIGAPLGAIIRKGGLGFPIIISVLVFIIYYIFENTGYRMARSGIWTVNFGKGLAPAVLIPLAAFVTYKANNDSMVLNIDTWKSALRKAFGIKTKRHITGKEVIIHDPDYTAARNQLQMMTQAIENYVSQHKLRTAPNVQKVFFNYEPDHEIEHLSELMENIIEDLSNTRDKYILNELNNYPILMTKAHTRPFDHQWLNVLSAVIVPLGLFFYLRMWRFRLTLMRDLKQIVQTNNRMIDSIDRMLQKK